MDDARRVPLFEKQGDGEFEVAEADAQLFLDNHEDLHGAPLRCVRNKVDDSTVGGRVPHITVRPPDGIGVRPGARQKTRLPHDRKQLTEHGRAALARVAPSRVTGELWRGSKVFLLDFQCKGTPLCDLPAASRMGHACCVRVRVWATIEQVDKHKVSIVITGVPHPRASPHSQAIAWDPAKLRESRDARQPAERAQVKRRFDELQSRGPSA